jgi:hypothetical protein
VDLDWEVPAVRCGDGVAQGTEACDGTDLDGASCADLGEAGELRCTATCTLDRSGCRSLCGNGILDPGEVCDGSELDGATCGDLGFQAGTLACGSDCELDTSDCREHCGDGVANGEESCDGSDLAGATCVTLGFHGGSLSCSASCVLDLDGCQGFCGDGIVNGPEGCDGEALGGHRCSDFGYLGGTLGCQPDCQAFSYEDCWTVPRVLVNEIATGPTDWLEIQNLCEVEVDLEGWLAQVWQIQESVSGSTSDSVLTLPEYRLAPGQRLVIEESGTISGDPPVVLAGKIVFNQNIAWNWMGGGAALWTGTGVPVDFVRFGSPAFTPAPPAGTSWLDLPAPLVGPGSGAITVSLSRRLEGTDTDTADDFCLSEATPGAAPSGTCLTPFPPRTLLVTEVAPGNPARIEVFNPGAVAVELDGWRIKNESTTQILPGFALGPGQYVAITDDAVVPSEPFADGTGLHVGDLTVRLAAGALSLLEPVAQTAVEFLRWGSSQYRPTPPAGWEDVPANLPAVGAGQSLARGTLVDSDTAGDFCLQAPSIGSANASCP